MAAKTRTYKSGSTWALWRWTEVPTEYILRLHVVKTPWFAICVHWLNKPDPEPWLHDHPVSFLSIILKGWYVEERMKNGKYFYQQNVWWNYIKATPKDRHTIVHVAPKTITLCFMGPKIREWGYHTFTAWVHWKDYNKENYSWKSKHIDKGE